MAGNGQRPQGASGSATKQAAPAGDPAKVSIKPRSAGAFSWLFLGQVPLHFVGEARQPLGKLIAVCKRQPPAFHVEEVLPGSSVTCPFGALASLARAP